VRPFPGIKWVVKHTDKHGPFNPEGGSYLAFLGRISPEKRPDRAIEIAKRAGIPLKLAAKVDAVDLKYFETEIAPLLDHPLVEFIGEIDETQKCEFLGKARALLFPIDWPEPFGLVMIEAMSAGTPVIAWRNGSVPEVVTEGVSGRIVDSIESAVDAVQHAPRMDRRKVRAETVEVEQDAADGAGVPSDRQATYLLHRSRPIARRWNIQNLALAGTILRE
jgi:glycosyltransferase involved in cell wall biosynthesis